MFAHGAPGNAKADVSTGASSWGSGLERKSSGGQAVPVISGIVQEGVGIETVCVLTRAGLVRSEIVVIRTVDQPSG